MKKIIFFDIDGTLLNQTDTREGTGISKRNREQLQKLREQGFLLYIASGRPYSFISDSISDFGFDGYVLCNGAHVAIDENTNYYYPIGKEKVLQCLEAIKKYDCEYVLETDYYSYLHPQFKLLRDFFLQCNINKELLLFDFVEADILEKVLKMEINTADENLHHIQTYIEKSFNYDFHGTENCFEIYDKAVTKATGVETVLQHFGIDKENSYAFGDGENDIEMLQVVGHGVAMGNAVPALKEVADAICGHVEEDGLALALESLLQ